MSASSWIEFAPAFMGQGQIFVGRLLGLLDEAMNNQDLALFDAEQHTRDATARKTASQFPQAIAHGTAERHSHRPSELNPHEVLPDDVPVAFIQTAQPIAHHLGACSRPVENNRHPARPVSIHAALYIIHEPFNVHS
jgi:hypothetical protein